MASSDATENLNKKQQIKLYNYFRSTSSCRVRIALNLKGIDYDYKAVNLLKGEQLTPEYLELNPMGYVPALVDGDITIADSFAIIMFLEEKYPQHPLLPNNLVTKAVNFQAASIVSSGIHPLHNLSVLKYIGEKVSPDEKLPWVQSHIRKGFTALEKLLSKHAGKYATGDEVYLADIFLAPQIDAAIKRFSVDMVYIAIGDGRSSVRIRFSYNVYIAIGDGRSSVRIRFSYNVYLLHPMTQFVVPLLDKVSDKQELSV